MSSALLKPFPVDHKCLALTYFLMLLLQMPWEDVRNEMVNEKGLSEEAADQIGEYVSMQGKG